MSRPSQSRRAALWILAAGALASLVLCLALRSRVSTWIELGILLGAPAGIVCVARWLGVPLAYFGFRLEPIPRLGYWLKVSALLCGVSLLMLALVIRLTPSPTDLNRHGLTPHDFATRWLPVVGVLYPIGEELLFRAVLLSALRSLMNRTMAIVIDGLAFAGIHWLYGNPDPFNQMAGFFFAWAYVKSGRISVPLILHVAGNITVGVLNLTLAKYADTIWGLVH